MPRALVLVLACCLGCTSIHADPVCSALVGIPMRGQVLYPDGTPAVGATVVATTVCPQDMAHFVTEVQAGEDGLFSITSFDPKCGLVRFTAEHRERFWLKTGIEVFYPSPNGTTPELDISITNAPPPVTLLLEARGGEVEFQVWDDAIDGPIYAGLDIERVPVEGKAFGSITIATGKDGSSHTRIFPEGKYRASVFEFPCGTKTFFAAARVWETFDVIPGQRVLRRLTLNTLNIEAEPSYDNPSGQKCRP